MKKMRTSNVERPTLNFEVKTGSICELNHCGNEDIIHVMNAVEFPTELSGSATLAIPADVAAKLPRAGRARVLVLTEDNGADPDWQTAAYQQFLRDDCAEDAIYETLK